MDELQAALPIAEGQAVQFVYGPPTRLEPVEIEQVRECLFKAKLCALCGLPKSNKAHTPKITSTCDFKRQNGCAHCGRAKNDPCHLGAPESFNLFAGRDGHHYTSAIDRWKKALAPLLAASDLPPGCSHVAVEGEVSFGDGDRPRDQGNHRVIIEKALGDALVDGGYLDADTWDHYEFGGLARNEERGVNRIRLMLFPAIRVAGIVPLSSGETRG